MSIHTKSHISFIKYAVIGIVIGYAYFAYFGMPGEISTVQYDEVFNDINTKCPDMEIWIDDAYSNDDMISIDEYNLFKQYCGQQEEEQKRQSGEWRES